MNFKRCLERRAISRGGERTENKGNTGQRLTGANSVGGDDRDLVNEVKGGGEEGAESVA